MGKTTCIGYASVVWLYDGMTITLPPAHDLGWKCRIFVCIWGRVKFSIQLLVLMNIYEMQSNRYFCLLSLIVLTYIWLLSFLAIMNELITPFFNVIAISFSKFGSFLNLHCFTVIFYYCECSLCRTFSINRAVYWFYVLFNMSN